MTPIQFIFFFLRQARFDKYKVPRMSGIFEAKAFLPVTVLKN